MFKKKANLQAVETKQKKSAFTQLTLLSPLQAAEHKITRESSYDSDFELSNNMQKNNVDDWIHRLDVKTQRQLDNSEREKTSFFKSSPDIKCRKRISHKIVDTENISERRSQEFETAPSIVKGSWTKQQDQLLIQLVTENGAKNWSTIAKKLKGRMGKQCRQRWHNHLNPDINKKKWTQQQDQKIIEYHKIFGNKWAYISKHLPGRTDNAIKNHWNSTISRRLAQQGIQKQLTIFQSDLNNVFFTPKKNKDSNQWNTDCTLQRFDSPDQNIIKKQINFVSPVSLNLFNKKKPDIPEIDKKSDSKIGVVLPVFNFKIQSSSLILDNIHRLLDIDY